MGFHQTKLWGLWDKWLAWLLQRMRLWTNVPISRPTADQEPEKLWALVWSGCILILHKPAKIHFHTSTVSIFPHFNNAYVRHGARRGTWTSVSWESNNFSHANFWFTRTRRHTGQINKQILPLILCTKPVTFNFDNSLLRYTIQFNVGNTRVGLPYKSEEGARRIFSKKPLKGTKMLFWRRYPKKIISCHVHNL